MHDLIASEVIAAFFGVVMIDLTLAGDNAVVIGLAAAGLPPQQRTRAILIGILVATVLRVAFASVAVQLLNIVGLLLAGGVLLLWVAWKMYQELRAAMPEDLDGARADCAPKTLAQAVTQIVVADVSMSLDNVLAVAGAAHEHPIVLVFGLTLSVLLMGLAAGLIARLLNRHRWISWIGLLIILGVALNMMWDGGMDVVGALTPEAASPLQNSPVPSIDGL
ncbi:MAG: YjbE family putative metal transport protein [Limimaricola sp.]|uniref:TerC family protein n=1 Tax=Limimaricola sp. TaxID=2211665 RepID=UPI001D8E6AD7|nr:TerC family protein [Limimaricola sp.]MBI1415770.1 YjbE family putative metal transport protein [Limimaricola sp.]